MTRRIFGTLIGLTLLVVVVALWLVSRPATRTMHATAHFDRTVGLYVGSSVRILGVPVGKVTRIEPAGRTVTVDFTYDGKYHVPAGATAVIVPPSIVGDRYLQLTPVYTGGPRMSDRADIPASRTAAPLEYDEIMGNLDKLDTALGPQGANSSGALSRLLDVSAANLKGNGAQLHQTLHDVSQLVATLGDNAHGLVGTIDNLDTFTGALAADDQGVRRVNDDLAQVSTQLAGERQDLAAALDSLSVALTEVGTFVRGNRGALTTDLAQLTDVTTVLAKNERALTEFWDVAPLALKNLQDAYDPNAQALRTRTNIGAGPNPAAQLCNALALLHQPCPDSLKHAALGPPSPPTAFFSPSSLQQMLAVKP